jgi:hypothetical protein
MPQSETNLPKDEGHVKMQVFTPIAAKSQTLLIADGTATLDTNNIAAYTFQPSATVTRKLGANATGPSFAGAPDSSYGPYGVAEGMTQIVFAGTNGVTIEIEAM